jgi:DNA-binding winged helix-turn-helix (wHTH) protein
MSTILDGNIRFGPYQLDIRSGELRKGGTRVRLPDQPFQVLLMLLERPGEVVSREEIRSKLWLDSTVVEFDHSINAAVKRLRNALRESADKPRYIETLPRRGYRFIGQVETRVPACPAVLEGANFDSPIVQIDKAPNTRRWPPWLIAAATLVALGTALVFWFSRLRPKTESVDALLKPVPFTTYPGYEMLPSFSPDGTRVAFSWQKSGSDYPDVYIKLLGPGQPVRLSSAGGFGPAWSPDGRFVAFCAQSTCSMRGRGHPYGGRAGTRNNARHV